MTVVFERQKEEDRKQQRQTESDKRGEVKLRQCYTLLQHTHSSQAGESWRSKLSWLSNIVAENAV